MLIYVPPHDLTVEQIDQLEESWKVGGGTRLELVKNILRGDWKVFAVKGGILAVSKAGDKLTVEALNVQNFGWFMRQFRDAMDRLATDWKCNTVETFCFDQRLAAAMLRIRGKHVATLVQWDVEGMSNGR